MGLVVLPTFFAMLVSLEGYPIIEYLLVFLALVISMMVARKLQIIGSSGLLFGSLLVMIIIFKILEGATPIALISEEIFVSRKVLAIAVALIPVVVTDVYWNSQR